MLNKIPLFSYAGSVVTPNIDLELIAETLGLNVDLDTKVLYTGDDPTTGFCFSENSSSNMEIKLINKGVVIPLVLKMIYVARENYLFYKLSENGVMFGIENTDQITFCVAPGTDVDTGEMVNCYLATTGAVTTSNTTHYVVLSERGLYSTYNPSGTFTVNPSIVSLAPLVCSNDNLIFNKVFTPSVFMSTADYREFDMGGKSYLSPNSNNSAHARFILEL